jgi:hypothetical protein
MLEVIRFTFILSRVEGLKAPVPSLIKTTLRIPPVLTLSRSVREMRRPRMSI